LQTKKVTSHTKEATSSVKAVASHVKKVTVNVKAAASPIKKVTFNIKAAASLTKKVTVDIKAAASHVKKVTVNIKTAASSTKRMQIQMKGGLIFFCKKERNVGTVNTVIKEATPFFKKVAFPVYNMASYGFLIALPVNEMKKDPDKMPQIAIILYGIKM
jgi:hypothetical protein